MKPDYARLALRELVEYVSSQSLENIKGITYQDLATRIGFPNKDGHGMGKVLCRMGNILNDAKKELGESIPYIQSLVVLKNGRLKGLPDEGLKEFWEDYPNLSKEEKISKVHTEYIRIIEFENRWNNVLSSIEGKVENVDFFKQSDIDWYANEWAKKAYTPNDEQKAVGEKIRKIIYPKVRYWANEVVERLADFELYKPTESWQMGRRFYSHFYVNIRHKDHRNIEVNFTVGVNVVENVLICKLDLPPKWGNDIEIKWSEYWLDKKCNWEKLISETVDFINKYKENYYQAVFDIEPLTSKQRGGLTLEDFPTGLEKLPDKKREFKGIDINFNDEQARKSTIGSLGEYLVLENERQKLKNNNLQHLVSNVIKVKDGCGYDICSYDEKGEKLFIEVKSTEGKANTPFFISANEVEYHKKNKSIIYRVYDLDVKEQKGKYFIISDWEGETISDTVVFRSVPRKKT